MSKFKKSDVVAIVVTYASAKQLNDCLASLKSENVAVIVVDNASPDNSREIALEASTTVVANLQNEGYGRANNKGVDAATAAKFCLIVNPDVRIDAGLIAAFLAAAEKYPDVAIFGPRIIEPNGRIFDRPTSILENGATIAAARDAESDSEAINLSGACLFVRRDVFKALGGFDPSIFLFYEDDDLCFRARQSGWKLMTIGSAVARHKRGTSTTPTPEAAFRTRYHQAWSRQYVIRKHSGRGDALAMLTLNAIKYAGALLIGSRRRQIRYGGSIAGTWAAMLGRTALEREGLQ